METFPASPAASQGSSGSTKSSASIAQFGDKYSQRIPETLHNLSDNLKLTWKSITPAERDTLVTFLRARNGVEAFSYTLPDELTAKTYYCPQWDWNYSEGILIDLDATFIEVFES